MGASESIEVTEDEDQQQDKYEDEFNDQGDHNETIKLLGKDDKTTENVLEQDPETPSISSLSPQLSSFSTPRFYHSVKESNPFITANITNNFSSESRNDDRTLEIYVICHGECHMNLRPDLVGGRCPEAALTPNGKRQSRALAVFLKSQGIRFNDIYTSPLDRARSTAIPVCQVVLFH